MANSACVGVKNLHPCFSAVQILSAPLLRVKGTGLGEKGLGLGWGGADFIKCCDLWPCALQKSKKLPAQFRLRDKFNLASLILHPGRFFLKIHNLLDLHQKPAVNFREQVSF
jgi:hypothetical protein